MTNEQFFSIGREISAEAKVLDTLHGYFETNFPRIYQSCQIFGLLERPLGDVLEIGPFYGYLPFLLRAQASSYTVLEGDDPAVYALKPLYERSKIDFRYIDFFEVFGPTTNAVHKLDLPDNHFDTILCWETMEHFNFNPVKFVREVLRVLKPGGKVCITVPNTAAFPALASLMFGRNETNGINGYFTFEDYESNGKKAFYGFHWREYSRIEMEHLFATAGFKIDACSTFTTFSQNNVSPVRRLLRMGSYALASMLPRFGKNVYLIAEKKA